MRRAAIAIALALIGPVAPAAAQMPKPPSAADWDKVVAAARQEGEVSLYTSFLGAPFQTAMIKQFQAETGIKVNVLDARPTELEQRIRAEYGSNRHLVDLYITGIDQIAIDDHDGLIGPAPAVPNLANLRPDFASQVTPKSVPAYLQAFGILANTDAVKPADLPASWADLADPKWRGRMQADDPDIPGSGLNWFAATLRAPSLGQAYEERMATQKIVFDRNIGDDEQRVARGEFLLRFPEHFNIGNLKGLPVKLIVPKEGASYAAFFFTVMAGAPHPNATAVMINWYLGQGQINYANAGMVPVVGNIADKVDPAERDLIASPLLGTETGANREADLALAHKIYKP